MCARSPLAPKKTSASDAIPPLVFGAALAGFFVMTTELFSHGAEETIRVVGVAPGFEAGKQRSADHRRRHTFIDRCERRPAPLP